MQVIRGVAAAHDGVVTRAQALRAGLARHQVDSLCRAGRWWRLGPATYFVGTHPATMSRRGQIRAAVSSLGPGAVAVRGTAAELHGIAGLPNTREIHVSVPGVAARVRGTRDPGLTVHQLVLPRSHVVNVAGIATTSVLRTVADTILTVDRMAAVSVLDSAVNQALISVEDLAGIPPLVRGRPGAVAARRVLSEVDGRAQSPLETRVRLRCVDGRVPPDDLQFVVRDDDGYILAVTDLAWRCKVAAEADGVGPHSTPQALFEDRRRQNRLANAGWRVLRFTWADTMRPDYIPFVVRQAVHRQL